MTGYLCIKSFLLNAQPKSAKNTRAGPIETNNADASHRRYCILRGLASQGLPPRPIVVRLVVLIEILVNRTGDIAEAVQKTQLIAEKLSEWILSLVDMGRIRRGRLVIWARVCGKRISRLMILRVGRAIICRGGA